VISEKVFNTSVSDHRSISQSSQNPRQVIFKKAQTGAVFFNGMTFTQNPF